VVAPPTQPKTGIRKRTLALSNSNPPCNVNADLARSTRTMAPKIMYGKNKAAAKVATNFSKFISPEKEEATAKEDAGHGGATAVKESGREQPKNAAKHRSEGDGVAALEEGLMGLRLGQTQTVDRVATTKQKARTPKPVHHRNASKAKKTHEPQVDLSKDTIEAAAVGEEMKILQAQVVVQAPKARRRIALEPREANSDVTRNCNILEMRSQKDKKWPKDSVVPLTPAKTRSPKSRKQSKASSSSQNPQLLTPAPTPEPGNLYFTYASPLLSLSDGKKIVPFAQWSSELEPHFEITKIAEASFSEVYRLSALSPTGIVSQESVLKVVALKTPLNAPLPCQTQTRAVRDREGQAAKEIAERDENDAWKSDVHDVLSEVKLLQNLNHIPGFTNFRDMTILQGRPSPVFSDAWKAWNKSRPRGKKSEFPDPSKKASYDDTQLWAIVEMQDAGTDCEKIMEHGGLRSIWEVWDVFWGVCLSVAKAEEACKFEHRDLHMGNICVRSSRGDGDVMQVTVKDPMRRKFRFTGLETTVIDYTLSRADILPSPSRRSSSSSINTAASASSNSEVTDQDVAWLDLNKDPAIFEGDAAEEYQYEIYRYMRGAALYRDPLQNTPREEVPDTPRRSPRKNTHIRFDETGSPPSSPRKPGTPQPTEKSSESVWKQFHPRTNLVWTHFLLHKLLTHLDSSAKTPDQLSTKQIMSNIDADEMGAEPLKLKKKALKLYSVLTRVSELLCPVALGRQDSLGSVKELVVMALEERWLRVGDVAA
jgi:serine/threonine-protein kinase haspin